MKKSILFLTGILVCLSLAAFLFGQNAGNSQESPKLFAEGIINTSADEYNPTFTPDGKTVYFTRRLDRKGSEAIMFLRFENGKWTSPQIAEFSGKFYDKESFVSPDGKRFSSLRCVRTARRKSEFRYLDGRKNCERLERSEKSGREC